MTKPENMQAIWESGVDLDTFFDEFSSPDLLNRALRLRKRNKKPLPRGIQMLADGAEKNGDQFAQHLAKAFLGWDLHRDLHQRRDELLRRNNEVVCELLRNAAYVTTGYRRRSRIGAEPELIPHRFIIPENVEFQRCTVVVGRTIFESVRVTTKEPLASPQFIKKRAGRKSIDPLLRQVVADLREAGKLDDLMQKQRVSIVREEIRRRRPGEFAANKPGDTKIRAALTNKL